VCYDDFKNNKIPRHTFGPQIVALQVKGLFESITFQAQKSRKNPTLPLKKLWILQINLSSVW
jgi:hypothetical protein